MEQKKTAGHPTSDRPRSPATEARIKEKNRRVIMTVSLFVFLAAGNLLMKENDKWKLRETTVIPTAVIVEGKAPDKDKTKKQGSPTSVSIEEKIFAQPSKYPASFLDALKRNPEIADFVAAYPDTPQKAFGGIRESERPEKVPLFIQWYKRWGYVPYGQSNVGISGCGPTCLSMVLYSLTGDKNLSPDMLAARAMENGYYVEGVGTSWLFMTDIAVEYGITVSQFPSVELQKIEEVLAQGGLLICAMGPGDFTDEGHFIVIRGLSDRMLTINDPFSKANSRKKWDYSRVAPQVQQVWTYVAQ